MNKKRREKVADAFELVRKVQELLQEVKEEEQEALDNLPDSLRDSEKGEQMQEYVELMEEAGGYLDDAASVIGQI